MLLNRRLQLSTDIFKYEWTNFVRGKPKLQKMKQKNRQSSKRNFENYLLYFTNFVMHASCTVPYQSIWFKGLPFPGWNSKYFRDPIEYRCMSLISQIAKLHSYILNSHLHTYLEDTNILSEEQNGFRKLHSCPDHIYSLCTVMRNQK